MAKINKDRESVDDDAQLLTTHVRVLINQWKTYGFLALLLMT
jgi:hypothetical protein